MTSPSPASLRSSSGREHPVSWSPAGLPKRGHMPHLMKSEALWCPVDLLSVNLACRPLSSFERYRPPMSPAVWVSIGTTVQPRVSVLWRTLAPAIVCLLAPVAQRIEYWPPEPGAWVRIPPGVLSSRHEQFPRKPLMTLESQCESNCLPSIPPVRPVRKAR